MATVRPLAPFPRRMVHSADLLPNNLQYRLVPKLARLTGAHALLVSVPCWNSRVVQPACAWLMLMWQRAKTAMAHLCAGNLARVHTPLPQTSRWMPPPPSWSSTLNQLRTPAGSRGCSPCTS